MPKLFFNCISTQIAIRLDHRQLLLPLRLTLSLATREIEWFTKERGSIILYGLLVKLDEAG